MKKIIAFVLFVLVYTAGYSQTWQQVDSLSTNPRNRSASFTIGGKLYVVAGGYTWYINDAWEYSPSANSWAQIANYPSDSDDGVVGFSINGTGYVGTGAYCCYEYSNSFFKYDTLSKMWSRLPPLPGQGRSFGVGFTLDGKGYIGGGLNGYNNDTLTDFYCYDPGNNTWSKIANCPAAGVSFRAVAFTIGDKAYVGTGGQQQSAGSSSYVPQSDFWEYDTTSKVWTRVSDFGGGPRELATGFAACGKGYLGTGCTDVNQSIYTNDFWEYDPSAGAGGTWTEIANFGGVPRVSASSFVVGNTGYVGFGYDGTSFNNGYADDLWILNYVPAFSSDTMVCEGGSIAFTDTSTYSPDHWLWSFPGGKPATSSVPDPTVEYDTAGTFSVTLTAWNACDSGTKIVTNYITVAPFSASITITPVSPSVCNGQTITLVANGGANVSYQWVGTTDTTDSITVNPAKDTTYELQVGNGSCSKDTMISVMVNNPPPLIINPPSPAVECNGQPILITVPASGSDYTWYPATGLSATTGSSVTANPTADITYSVTGTDSLGCTVSNTEAISIQYGPNKPTITVSVTGDTLFSSAKNGDQWYLNGTPVNGATDSLYVITGLQKGDSITVSVINVGNGCSTTSDAFVTGINQLSVISNQLSIYPNPTNGMINVTISSSATGVKNWSLRVTDVLGRTLYTRSSLNYNNEVDLSDLPGGMYFITVITKTARGVVPVVKQN